MAGHLLFNSGSNESSLAPQFKWLDNTFNHSYSRLLMREKLTWLRRGREAKCGNSFRRTTFICLLYLSFSLSLSLYLSNCALNLKVHKHEIFFSSSDSASCKPVRACNDSLNFETFPLFFVNEKTSFSLSE